MATEKDQVNGGLIATIVLAGTIIVFAIIMVLTAYTRAQVREELEAKEGTANLGAKRRFLAAEEAELRSPAAWRNQAEGLARIPSAHAETLVLQEIAANPQHATPGGSALVGTDADESALPEPAPLGTDEPGTDEPSTDESGTDEQSVNQAPAARGQGEPGAATHLPGSNEN